MISLVSIALVLYASPAGAMPATPNYGKWADPYSEYEPEASCSPAPKPGVLALRDMLNETYGAHTAYMEPPRGCTNATSEHEDGRALDYMLKANDPNEKAIADDIFAWLLATDKHGNTEVNARRLGLMYIVWNKRIWSSNVPVRGWRAYDGSNPHTDHIHFSFSWDGAHERTTWWSTATRTHFADLDGDGRDEIVLVRPDGRVVAWRNHHAIASNTYTTDGSIRIGRGFDPVGIRFADLDGDGRDDLVNVDAEGSVKVWRNLSGFSEGTYNSSALLTVGWGFDRAQARFADLTGDGRAEILSIYSDGAVKAWRNTAGFDERTYTGGRKVQIGSNFDLRRTKFGDLDGDRRDEIILVLTNGEVKVWRNTLGFAGNTYTSTKAETVGWGFSPPRTRLGDVDGDGRDDLMLVRVEGEVKVWRNSNGLTSTTYTGSRPVVVGQSFPL